MFSALGDHFGNIQENSLSHKVAARSPFSSQEMPGRIFQRQEPEFHRDVAAAPRSLFVKRVSCAP